MKYLAKPAILEVERWNRLGDVHKNIVGSPTMLDTCDKCGESFATHGYLSPSREVLCPGSNVAILMGANGEPLRTIPEAAFESSLVPSSEIGKVSDGYHTFDELYEHRHMLFLALANLIETLSDRVKDSPVITKSRKNKDGSSWDGYFVVSICLPLDKLPRQVSYHLPERLWSLAAFTETETNDCYDGHTSDDVIMALKRYSIGLVLLREASKNPIQGQSLEEAISQAAVKIFGV